jgi:hypothetical protein
MVTPLQIGIGIVDLINSLRVNSGKASGDTNFRIRELKGELIRSDNEVRQLKDTIQKMKDNKVIMERQIEQLMSHIRCLTGSRGISLSDIFKDPPKE